MEQQKTAQERADEYIENSNQIHEQFIKQFEKDEAQLNEDPEVDIIKEKLKKREQDEFKKLEKILKKERNDFEDVSGPGANAKQVHDKIVRTLNNMRKISKEL